MPLIVFTQFNFISICSQVASLLLTIAAVSASPEPEYGRLQDTGASFNNFVVGERTASTIDFRDRSNITSANFRISHPFSRDGRTGSQNRF